MIIEAGMSHKHLSVCIKVLIQNLLLPLVNNLYCTENDKKKNQQKLKTLLNT